MNEQLSRFIYWIKGKLHIVDYTLVPLWIFAWWDKAHNGTNFDLDKLWQAYVAIRGFVLAQFGIDSKFNSPPGVPPEQGGNNGNEPN